MIKAKIKERLKKEQFNPSFLGLFVNPFYFARKGLYQNISSLSKEITDKILDIGCGQKPYEKLFNVSEYIGLEIDTPENRESKKADYFYDGKIFPFDNQEFDCVIMNEVFEHIFNPEEFLTEINRVLKLNGKLLITVPFVWDEHEQPFDYARYSSFGLKYLLEKHGFEIIEYKKSINDIRVIFQLINAYLYKILISSHKYWNLFIILFLMSPFNIIGEILNKFLPKNEDLYLDSIVLAKKI